MEQSLIYFGLFALSLGLSLALVPLVMRFSLQYDIVDRPGGRKAHSSARPLLGGLAIVLSIFCVVSGGLLIATLFGDAGWMSRLFPHAVTQLGFVPGALPGLAAMAAGAAIIVAIGIIDDLRGIGFPYQLKFAAQFLGAFVLVANGVHTSFLPTVWLNQLLSVIWIVGITNAFNLLDNMDGLSAGTAAIAGSIFLFISAEQGQFFTAMLLSSFVGATLGFLKYNFNPARIFMGDTGSLFLGFVLAGISLSMSYTGGIADTAVPVTIVVPLLVLSLPIFDTLSVMLIRWREGRPLFVGDKRHFSHRLVALGMTRRGAVVFIYLVTVCIGVSAAFLPWLPSWGAWLVLLQTVAIYAMISIIMNVGRKKQLEVARRRRTAGAASERPLAEK